MNANKTNFDVQSFIIFDPTLTDEEDEEESKILYCYPKGISIKERTMTTGLCEAMCNFAREFTSSPCQYIHTMKTRVVLHILENNISMILTINIPTKNVSSLSKTLPIDNRKKSEYDGYHDDEIQNSVCESIVKHCRQMFFLFMGPPSLIIKNAGIDSLRTKLAIFFNKFIGQGVFDNYQITDSLSGVNYLVLDNEMCSNVERFIAEFQEKFPTVFCSMFLFNNNLIFSNINKEDLGIIYRYLTANILAKYSMNETMNSTFTTTNMGRYIVVSHTPSTSLHTSDLPKMFFNTNDFLRGQISALREGAVLVYKALQATVVFFVDEYKLIDENFSATIHEYLGPRVTSLAQSIGKRIGQIANNNQDNVYKYLYWNPETLSVKSTLYPPKQSKSDFTVQSIPCDTLRLMSDIKEEFDRDDHLNEMTVKLHSDSWVTGVKDDRRELLVAINKRNYSLVDVSKEMKLICNRYFHDIIKLQCE